MASMRCARIFDGASHYGVASFGVRPTVNGVAPLLETYLFDFAGDLYGKEIEVEFVARIRERAKSSPRSRR